MRQEICIRTWISQGKTGYVFISQRVKGKWKDNPLEFDPNSDKQINEIRKFMKDLENLSGDLYWCPNIFTQPHRRREYVSQGKFLYADLDAVDPREIDEHLRPTIAWKSSKHRYQALWELKSPLEASQLEEINRRLTYTLQADKSGWDLTQVLRIPGTMNYKYQPPEKGILLWDDGPIYKLDDLLPYLTEVEANIISEEQRMATFIRLLSKYKKRIPHRIYQLLQYPPKEVNKRVGKRSDILWSIEHELIKAQIPLDDIVELIRLSAWNKYRGRRDEQKRIYTEVSKIYEALVAGETSGKSSTENINVELLDSITVVKPISEYETQEINWLWYPYIPKGGITILDGDPGVGKTYLSLALVAHLSIGSPLPGEVEIKEGNQDMDPRKPEKVLYMTAEDDPGLTLRPRLELMKANLSNILICEGTLADDGNTIEPLDFSTVEGLETLATLCEKYKPALIIIDPFVAFIGRADINKANEVRPVMTSLNLLARKYNVAILLVRHLTKGARERIIYRGMGTIDLIAAARSSLLVAPDPDNPEIRIMFHQKHNLSRQGASLGYTITDQGFQWVGEVNISPMDALKPETVEARGRRTRDEAQEWLEEFLSQYPQGVSSQAILEAAKNNGFSKSTIRRAKKELDVVVKKKGSIWLWKLEE